MSIFSLPDIAAMLVLMGVLAWLRRRYFDDRVDIWLVGLTFVLIEMVAASIRRGSGWLPVATQLVALDSYLFAAVTFGWAARRELLPGTSRVEHYVLPALPLFLLATLFGLGATSPIPYLWIVASSLVIGLGWLLYFTRLRGRIRAQLILVHLAMWLPMLYLAGAGEVRWVVYWGLTCLYALVAFSFGRRARRDCIGSRVTMVSFVIWAMCFLLYPLAGPLPVIDGLIEQTWNIGKFFVVIGMLLLLLEDETQRRLNEAMHDPLTGLPNRRLFTDRLELAVQRSRRSGLGAAVFIIDLDGFKGVNDTYGHQMGDILLKRVADRLQRKVRGADTVARCGGDEFNVVVNDIGRAENCVRIAEALRTAIEAVRLPGAASQVRLSGSVGWALFPDDAANPGDLCQLADLRMYEAKRSREEVKALV